jgi:ribosomal protein S18 acetylase RimI-like enzyme
MANHASRAEDPIGIGHRPKLQDFQILEQAIRESIHTSPGAFLKTIEDVDNRESDYWLKEIGSSTWAVIQRGDEAVGIAVARRPNPEMDSNLDWAEARFIESLWIAPELRGGHLAERLVRFLFEVECTKTPSVRQFLLWVLDENSSAIRLYERMGFMYLDRQVVSDWSGRTELRYECRPEPDAAGMKATAQARQDDLHRYGVIYRVLGNGETA